MTQRMEFGICLDWFRFCARPFDTSFGVGVNEYMIRYTHSVCPYPGPQSNACVTKRVSVVALLTT